MPGLEMTGKTGAGLPKCFVLTRGETFCLQIGTI